MDKKLDDFLQHHGVKGMKWGVRKRVSKEIASLGREAKLLKTAFGKRNASTQEINDTINRIRNESDYGKLSRKVTVGSTADRQKYLDRHKLSNKQLQDEVLRLKAKHRLNTTIKDTAMARFKLGKSIVDLAAPTVASASKSRAGKNLYEAMKGSDFRYVDGSRMKNVINP